MSILLVLGIVCIGVLLVNRHQIIGFMRDDSYMVRMLSASSWFQNHWYSGMFLFVLNAMLFGLTLLSIFLLGKLQVPFLHLFIMILAVFSSFYLWASIHQAWRGGRRERFIQGLMGSSVYLLLTLFFGWMLISLEADTPYHDSFMEWIGLVFGMLVSFVAFVTCLCMTGLTSKYKDHH